MAHLAVNEPSHLGFTQTFGRPVRRYNGQSCSLGSTPTLPDAICTRGVANVTPVTGFIVSMTYYFDGSRLATSAKLQLKKRNEYAGIASCTITLARTTRNTRVSCADLVEDGAQVQNRLIPVLHHHVGNDIVKFNNEPAEARFIGKGVLHVLWKMFPLDPFLIRRRYQVPRTVSLD